MNPHLSHQKLPPGKPPADRFTYDEFCSRINEQKADLIGGEIFMASPATVQHEDLVGFLGTILRVYVKRKRLGLVVGSRVAMKLSEENAPEPDLMFVSYEKAQLLRATEILGPADLVVEVISPGSRRMDSVVKKELYAKYEVGEYWLIDPYRQKADFWSNRRKKWHTIPVDSRGIVRSESIDQFWLRVDWLFAEQQPDEIEVVQTILAGYPPVEST